MGREAVSFTGSQAGIVTDTTHTKAKIVGISPLRVEQALADGKITLVAGFQGVSTNKDVTTLGRGGSDTTAVALAHALGAGVCEIYSDVDGVYTPTRRSSPRPASCSGLLRGDARDGGLGRAGPGAALGRVRAPLQSRDPQSLELLRRGGHLGERGR